MGSLPRTRNRKINLESLESRVLLSADYLYVGDAGNNSIQKFDAVTGEHLSSFVAANSSDLYGPRGLLFDGNDLLVVNQNSNTPFNGEVLRFDGTSGLERSPLVAADDPNAPFAPRGMVLRDNVLYVADFEGSTHARIAKYDATTGDFIGEQIPSGFGGEFRPRGLVFGVDGGLYASVFSESSFSSSDPAGYILRFDVNGTSRIVAGNNGNGIHEAGEIANLHNPEGLVFGPDGRIYVTSNWGSENTHILAIDPVSGNLLDDIVLDSTGSPDNTTRITAQAIAFGPSGKLFIPFTETSVNDGLELGGIQTYDPSIDQLASFVAPSLFDSPLYSPWYLAFGKTDPATLAYVSADNLAPVLSRLEPTALSYVAKQAATQITATIEVSDIDSATLSGATIQISENYHANQDVLSFVNTALLQGDWNSVTGTLRLVGNADVAAYETALRAVRFRNTSANPIVGTRAITFHVTDDLLDSNQLRREVFVAIPRSDYLFWGDQGDMTNPNDDTIKKFDLTTGELLGTWTSTVDHLVGPRGMVFNHGNLLVVNQNVGTPFNGEVLQFNGQSGASLETLVSADNPQAPFAPRGIVVSNAVLYVADFEGTTSPRVAKYNATTGAFIGDLVPVGFDAEFRPRGVVFGPDGKLYATVFSEASFATEDPAGYVLRFLDTSTGAFEIVAHNNGDGQHQSGEISSLHNPEGLAFGPDGLLYVTSFRANSSDTDKVLVIDISTHTLRDTIPLDQPGEPRAYAQSLLFGPDESLFVPIVGDGPDSGSVRRYDVITKEYVNFIQPFGAGGTMRSPWYGTFAQSNPATLSYQPWHNFVNRLDVDGSGAVVPLDALVVINELNNHTVAAEDGHLPTTRASFNFFFDVNGDGFISPLDALVVVNRLNNPQHQVVAAAADTMVNFPTVVSADATQRLSGAALSQASADMYFDSYSSRTSLRRTTASRSR